MEKQYLSILLCNPKTINEKMIWRGGRKILKCIKRYIPISNMYSRYILLFETQNQSLWRLSTYEPKNAPMSLTEKCYCSTVQFSNDIGGEEYSE